MKIIPEIAVIGLGRFGTFWANHLSKFYKVFGYDVRPYLKSNLNTIQVTDLKTCLGTNTHGFGS